MTIDQARLAVANPATDGATLQAIATQYRELWPQIAAHPNAYPALLNWLNATGDPATHVAIAWRQQWPTQPIRTPRSGLSAGAVVGIVISSVVALAMIISGVAWWLVSRQLPASPPPTITISVPQSPATTQSAGSITPPDGDAQRAWITVPGTPNAGAIIVDVQFDYQCPYCAHLENTFVTVFEALSDRGDIVLRYHTRTFLDNALGNDASTRAAIAAACVDYADNTKYAAYHNQIFQNQPSQEGTGYTDDRLTMVFTAAVGLTGGALDAFNTCYSGRQTEQFVQDVEANNILALPNASPPNQYLFGGNQPNSDDAQGNCTGVPNSQVGSCGVPDLYANGVRFSWSDLLNTDWSPKIDPTPDALLAFLQQVAG